MRQAAWLWLGCVPSLALAVPPDQPRNAEVLSPRADSWRALALPARLGAALDVAEIRDGRIAFTLRAPDAQYAREPRYCDVWNRATGAWTTGMFLVPTTPDPPPGGAQDHVHQLVDLHNGTALWVDTSARPPTVTLRPSRTPMPWPDVVMPRLVGGAWTDGSIMLLGEGPAGRSAHMWKPGDNAWTPAGPPSELMSGRLFTGPGHRAVLERPGALELWDSHAWKVLPALTEPRVGAAVLLAQDGMVVVAGGMLLAPRVDALNPGLVLRNAAGAAAVLGLWVMVWRRIPPRRRWAAALLLATVTMVLWLAGLWVLSLFAWH